MSDKKNAINFIMFNASNEDLEEVIRAVKFRRAELGRASFNTVKVGSKVTFTGRSGKVTGTVTKLGRKNIYVMSGITTWRVPANMLTII